MEGPIPHEVVQGSEAVIVDEGRVGTLAKEKDKSTQLAVEGGTMERRVTTLCVLPIQWRLLLPQQPLNWGMIIHMPMLQSPYLKHLEQPPGSSFVQKTFTLRVSRPGRPMAVADNPCQRCVLGHEDMVGQGRCQLGAMFS